VDILWEDLKDKTYKCINQNTIDSFLNAQIHFQSHLLSRFVADTIVPGFNEIAYRIIEENPEGIILTSKLKEGLEKPEISQIKHLYYSMANKQESTINLCVCSDISKSDNYKECNVEVNKKDVNWNFMKTMFLTEANDLLTL